MKNQISEKQIDQIAKSLLKSFPLDESAIEEIADSPKLLWNLNSRIATEKSKRKTGWFFGVRWQIAAFATFAVICGVVSANFLLGGSTEGLLVANETPVKIDAKPSMIINNFPSIDEKTTKPASVRPNQSPAVARELKKVLTSKASADSAFKLSQQNEIVNVKSKSANISTQTKNKTEKDVVETKTEFIALSYSPVSETGQIVRVKVPRSMMVSLGVSNNVSKNSELVNAEVIIDDDGSTRAIRFISEK